VVAPTPIRSLRSSPSIRTQPQRGFSRANRNTSSGLSCGRPAGRGPRRPDPTDTTEAQIRVSDPYREEERSLEACAAALEQAGIRAALADMTAPMSRRVRFAWCAR
jgi:hypothetical protein